MSFSKETPDPEKSSGLLGKPGQVEEKQRARYLELWEKQVVGLFLFKTRLL
jgi:hypothetical protein